MIRLCVPAYTCLFLCDEVEPFLPHFHPDEDDAYSCQVRVDGGELATEGVVLDDLLHSCSHLLHALDAVVCKLSVNGKLTLITFDGAVSAVFQNFE